MRLELMPIMAGLFVSAMGSYASPDLNDKRVDLSQEERDWIAHQPPIRTAVSIAYPPFSYRDAEGKVAGINLDLLDVISERTGLKFEILPVNSWEEVTALSEQRRVDLAPGVVETSERLKNYQFTKPYTEAQIVIIGREGDHRFSHISLLRQATIAMPRKHVITQALAERLPAAHVIQASNILEGFKMVEQKKADVTVANIFVATQYLNEHPGSKLAICGVVHEFDFPLRLCVHRDQTPLLGILDKGLASVSRDEMDNIFIKHLLFELQGERRVGLLVKWRKAILMGSALVGALLLLWNFTVRKEVRARRITEAELRKANHALREANQSMEVFSHSLSHDLKGPLRAISGFAEVLKEDYHDKLDGGQDYVDRIITAASRMDNLMRDVLAYCRVSGSGSKTPLQTVSLDPLVRQLIGEFPSDQLKYFQIISTLPDVQGDSGLLSQCIANLLSNAVKFFPKDRTPQVRIRAEQTGQFVKLWVEDNGIGIAPKNRQRIFKMFERAASSDYEGTGIGLAVVAKAMESMGGSVGVESELGEGSRFWIQLPLAPKEKPPARSGPLHSFRRGP